MASDASDTLAQYSNLINFGDNVEFQLIWTNLNKLYASNTDSVGDNEVYERRASISNCLRFNHILDIDERLFLKKVI